MSFIVRCPCAPTHSNRVNGLIMSSRTSATCVNCLITSRRTRITGQTGGIDRAVRALRHGTIVEGRCSILGTTSRRGAKYSRWLRPLSPPLSSLCPHLVPPKKQSTGRQRQGETVSWPLRNRNVAGGSMVVSAWPSVHADMTRPDTWKE